MHEIPNFPFPSLHAPEQTPATQPTDQSPTSIPPSDQPDTRRADRQDQPR